MNENIQNQINGMPYTAALFNYAELILLLFNICKCLHAISLRKNVLNNLCMKHHYTKDTLI